MRNQLPEVGGGLFKFNYRSNEWCVLAALVDCEACSESLNY